MVLTILSLIIFLAYVLAVCVAFGVPYSISDTYYKLERVKPRLGTVFTLFCWAVAIFLLPEWLDVTPDRVQFLCFLSAGGLCFVGAAAQFKQSLTKAVHYTSAAVCCVFSQVWVIGSGGWYMSILSFLIFLTIAYRDKKWMFWIEIAAFAATYSWIFLK